MMELNPNNPVTRQMEGQWHKVLWMLMAKLGMTEFEITDADIQRILPGQETQAIVADCRGSRFVIRVVSMEEGERLAREEGGLPT